MADKQQNILVNFKYNTAELERAQGIVNRANEATNKLQQSSQNAGKAIDQSFRSAASSLPNLIAKQKQLEDAIKSTKATNFATFKEFTKHLQGLSAQYSQVRTQIAAANKEIQNQSKAVKDVGTSVAGLTQNFGQLFSAIRLVVGAGIIREIVDTNLEMARLAGNTEGVSRAFNRAFPDAKLLLNDLTKATHGAVTEFNLMQKTLQATNLGVSAERLPILFEFAAARAQQTGESVDYLTNSIVTGIGRKSVKILDNLGLSTTRLKEQFDGVAVASKSVAEVTEGIADIAEVELAKMGGFAVTAATKVDQLKVSWQELRVEISKRFEEGGLATQLTELIDSYQAWLESRRRGISLDELFEERQREEIAQMSTREFLQRRMTKSNEENIKIIQEEIAEITKEIGAWAALRDQRNEVIQSDEHLIDLIIKKANAQEIEGKHAVEQIKVLKDLIEFNKRIRDANKEDALIDQEILKLLQAKLLALQKDNGAEKEALGIIEEKKIQIEQLNEQIEKTRKFSDLSSRLGVGRLITDLAIAQAELKELLEGPANKEFKVKFNIEGLAEEVKREVEFVRAQTSEGADYFVEIPIGPPKDKSKVLKDFEQLTDLLKELPAIPIPVEPVPIVPKDFGDKLGDAIRENQGELINAGTQIFADQLISFEDAEVASLQNRLNNLRNFYDEQILLAGDNERAKKELRLKEERETAALQKKIAQREKEARRFSVIIDTAAGIARAFATAPNIAVAIVQAALVAAQGASQLAIINRTVPRFAKGVIDLKGPGTGTSDSINAKLSRGESVMTAKETQGSRGILKDIRAKKLDDKVLQNLKLTADGVKYVGMDDSRIVKEIRELKDSQPNLVEQSGMLYRQFNKGKDYRRKVRLKNMGY